jgi:hypothetical protein
MLQKNKESYYALPLAILINIFFLSISAHSKIEYG